MRRLGSVSRLALTGGLVAMAHVGLAQDIVTESTAPASGLPTPGVSASTEEVSTAIETGGGGAPLVNSLAPFDTNRIFDFVPPPTQIEEQEDPNQLANSPPGPFLTLDFSTGLRIEDDEGLINRNTLGATLTTRTREQLLELSGGVSADVGADGVDRDFLPEVELVYLRDTGPLLLSLSGSYAVDDITGSVPGPNFFFDERDVISDDGTSETTQAAINFELGRFNPIGLEFSGVFRGRDFSDTEDPDLTDTSNTVLDAALRFDLSKRLTFRLTAEQLDVVDDGLLDADERETGVGGRITWLASPRTTIDLALSQNRRETTLNETADVISTVTGLFVESIPTGLRETSTQEGLVGDLSIRTRLPNGTIGLDAGRELSANGDIDRVSLSRRMTLANGATLTLAAGASSFEDSDTVPTFDLRYARVLKRGQIEAALQRDIAVDTDEQNVVRTRATLDHILPVSPGANLTTSIGLASIDIIDGFEEDQFSGDLGVSYTRELGDEWNMNLGYQGSFVRDEDSDSDNILFVNLQRTFTLRP